MTAPERTTRTAQADALCDSALQAALDGRPDSGLALVAVGGYGRRELAPYSDLDLVLVHDDSRDVGELGVSLWYPLWDSGMQLDHSVRALSEVIDTAEGDIRVAMGLLDARHVAGDPSITLRLRADILAHWRRDARRNLPDVRKLVEARAARSGELAHASVPDLKESYGGLRDATVLTHLVASWLVDVPHVDLQRARLALLDARDLVQAINGRAGDRIAPDSWGALAHALELPDEQAAQRHVRGLGRRIAHISRITWSRVDAVLLRKPGVHERRPELIRVATGVAVSRGEVVLDRAADPAKDPLLMLRAAAEAAERGLVLSPATAARLAKHSAPMPDPWPAEGRTLLARLLGSGPALLDVWETLDETGAIEHLLPEWSGVRLLGHASTVHRFTIDRHMIETCIEASRLIRRVERADLLLVAALLHDIGKGGTVDHSVAGAPIAAAVAARMGFSTADADTIRTLVRWHLLLPEVSTTRDVEDPVTIDVVAERVPDRAVLDLLEVLTEADARATAPVAWSSWRAHLVTTLAATVRARLTGEPSHAPALPTEVEIPRALRKGKVSSVVFSEEAPAGAKVTVIAPDRVGLMSCVAGALGAARLSILAARAWTQEGFGVSEWEVDVGVDPRLLTTRIDALLAGDRSALKRLHRAATTGREPTVSVLLGASNDATVLEVRMDDRPGVVHLVCQTLAELGLSVRSAHVATHGPQALDVFYVVGPDGRQLEGDDAEAMALVVRRAFSAATTLDH
jgi:[protein-PII] uridylyltransferase